MNAQQLHDMEFEERLAAVRAFARTRLLVEGIECPHPYEFREFLEIEENDESYGAWCAMVEAAYVLGFALGQAVQGLQQVSTSQVAAGGVR